VQVCAYAETERCETCANDCSKRLARLLRKDSRR
jgi:hypothetical protein